MEHPSALHLQEGPAAAGQGDEVGEHGLLGTVRTCSLRHVMVGEKGESGSVTATCCTLTPCTAWQDVSFNGAPPAAALHSCVYGNACPFTPGARRSCRTCNLNTGATRCGTTPSGPEASTRPLAPHERLGVSTVVLATARCTLLSAAHEDTAAHSRGTCQGFGPVLAEHQACNATCACAEAEDGFVHRAKCFGRRCACECRCNSCVSLPKAWAPSKTAADACIGRAGSASLQATVRCLLDIFP